MRWSVVEVVCFSVGAWLFIPIALADPTVPGFAVEVYAPITDPVTLSFAPNGDLYVGRDLSGLGAGPGDATRIRRVSAGGSIVEEFGPSIPDPDAVLFDANGLIAPTAGSVLVGSQNPSEQGEIRAIAPDESVAIVFGPTTAFVNPSDLVLDSSGRLLFTDHQNQDVKVTTGGTPTTLLGITVRTLNLAYDPGTDRLYTSGVDGTIRAHGSNGTPINLTFGTGRPIAVGPGYGAFGDEVYSVDNTTGELLRTDPGGNATVIGTGFATVFDLAFGPDGALYVSEFSSDRILRVAPQDVPAMSGVGLIVATLLLVSVALIVLPHRTYSRRAGCHSSSFR